MSEVKTMQDEMNEEWTELAIQNIHKLIPQEWMPRINEILPKLLNIVKIGIKNMIKSSSKQLGNRIIMMMNMPVTFDNSNEIFMVPHYIIITPDQIDFFQQPSEQFPKGEFKLKPGEVPIAIYSFATLAEKIQNYTDVKDLISDVQNGNFMKFTS